MKNICLYGGTFDPVHEGHIQSAKRAVEQYNIDAVIFLPTAQSPFKTGKKNLFTDEERLDILKESLKEYPWAVVSDVDLNMPQPSYSYRVVEHFKNIYPNDNLFWLLGTDQWDELHKWGKYDYLVENLTFIVQHRGTDPIKRDGVKSLFLNGDHPASASAIRKMLIEGTNIPENWMLENTVSLCKSILKNKKNCH